MIYSDTCHTFFLCRQRDGVIHTQLCTQQCIQSAIASLQAAFADDVQHGADVQVRHIRR